MSVSLLKLDVGLVVPARKTKNVERPIAYKFRSEALEVGPARKTKKVERPIACKFRFEALEVGPARKI